MQCSQRGRTEHAFAASSGFLGMFLLCISTQEAKKRLERKAWQIDEAADYKVCKLPPLNLQLPESLMA